MYCSIIAAPCVGYYPFFIQTSDRGILMNCTIAAGAMLFVPLLFFVLRAFLRDKYSLCDELSKRNDVNINIKID